MNQLIVSEILRIFVGIHPNWSEMDNHFLARTNLGNVVVLLSTANPECICGYIHLLHKGEKMAFGVMGCSSCDYRSKHFFQEYLSEEVLSGREFLNRLIETKIPLKDVVAQRYTELPRTAA